MKSVNQIFCLIVLIIIIVSCKKENDVNQTPENTVINTDTAVTIYLNGGHSKKLFALNASNGSVKWSITFNDNTYTSPIYHKGLVIVGCNDKKLYALDSSGVFKWSTAVDRTITSNPIIENDIIYFSDENSIYAVNYLNGTIVWKFTANGIGKIVFKNDVIYSNGGVLYALDAKTGNKLWQYYTNSLLLPIIQNDKLFTIINKGSDSLVVINTNTGKVIWSKQSFLFDEALALKIKNGNIYLTIQESAQTTYDGTYGLNILDSATGVVKYPPIHFRTSGVIDDYESPLFADNLLFLNTGYDILIFNANNATSVSNVNTYKINGLTMINNLIYYAEYIREIQLPVGGGSYYAGFVCAYDYKKNEIKWSKEFKNIDFLGSFPCIVTKSGKVFRSNYVKN